ncbi:hypothetical protein MMC24_000820 [Lignoscripta atroalba]|nr:hypothetical protein [Lignoscripta atroalba]
MAPLPSIDYSLISDLSVSSLELDRRTSPADLPTYLSTLSVAERKSLDTPSALTKRDDTPLSPLEAGGLLRARNPLPASRQYKPGSASISPDAINNKGIFALFALLAAALVLASIWFFFWAKNGGFVFRKGDWDDYKSTVLRRKGPDGKTLSNATKSTELGGGSVVGEVDHDDVFVNGGEKPRRNKKGKKNSGDDDVRAYRHEKPARVGGLNREADGSYHDFTSTEPSEISALPHKPMINKTKPKKESTKRSRKYSYAPGTESTFSVYSDDSHQPLRASPAHNRHSAHSSPAHTPTRSRQSSPKKYTPHPHHQYNHRASMSGNYTDPIDFETRYTASEAETDQSRGTKAYFHPIPGLTQGARTEGRGVNGFRRGGGRRRDSLSDSEGETGTAMS